MTDLIKKAIETGNEKLSSILGGYLILDSQARQGKMPSKNALQLRQQMFDEFESWLSKTLLDYGERISMKEKFTKCLKWKRYSGLPMSTKKP